MPEVSLTPRRRSVLALLAEGLSDREIADQLAISRSTVRSILEGLYRDTGRSGRVALVMWYLRYRLAHEVVKEAA